MTESNGRRKHRLVQPVRLAGSAALTTGHVAKICGVAARTVTKWANAGLLHCWRLPGGRRGNHGPDHGDRRFTQDAIETFLIEQRMDDALARLNAVFPRRVVLAGLPVVLGVLLTRILSLSRPVEDAGSLVGVGLAVGGGGVAAVVLDGSLGRAAVLAAGARLAGLPLPPLLVGIMGEDEVREDEWLDVGFASIWRHPVAAEAVAEGLGGAP